MFHNELTSSSIKNHYVVISKARRLQQSAVCGFFSPVICEYRESAELSKDVVKVFIHCLGAKSVIKLHGLYLLLVWSYFTPLEYMKNTAVLKPERLHAALCV